MAYSSSDVRVFVPYRTMVPKVVFLSPLRHTQSSLHNTQCFNNMAWDGTDELRFGHCGATSYGGDCASGSQGAWDANAIGVRSVQDCAAHCRAHCRRCNYVSFHRKNSACSWYARCPRLQRSFGGVVSTAASWLARSRRRAATAGVYGRRGREQLPLSRHCWAGVKPWNTWNFMGSRLGAHGYPEDMWRSRSSWHASTTLRCASRSSLTTSRMAVQVM